MVPYGYSLEDKPVGDADIRAAAKIGADAIKAYNGRKSLFINNYHLFFHQIYLRFCFKGSIFTVGSSAEILCNIIFNFSNILV